MWVTWLAPAHKQTLLKERPGMIAAKQGVPDRTDGQGAGTTADSPSVPWLRGQRPHDCDVTWHVKSLSCRGGRWTPSNQNTETLGDILQGTAAATACPITIPQLFSLLVTIWLLWQLHFTPSSYQHFHCIWKNGHVPVQGRRLTQREIKET